MKYPVSVLLMALLGFGLCLFLPWWTIAVACFLVALLIPMHPFDSFLAGFASMAFLWGGLALFISYGNEHLMARKISVLILKSENPYLSIVVTAIIGGFTGGLSSLSASWLRFKKK